VSRRPVVLPSNGKRKKPMSTLIGGVTLASTLFGVLVGQIAAGAEFAGVVLASLIVMTLRA